MAHTTTAALRPIGARFFPATRIGLICGVVLGLSSGLAARSLGSSSTPPPPSPEDVYAVATTPAPITNADGRAHDVVTPRQLHGPAVVNVWLQGCSDCMP